MTTYEIIVDYTWQNWIVGTIDGMEFEAKVYDTGSKFGIDGGRISKLAVCRTQPHGEIIAYERGWEVFPDNSENKDILDALLRFCAQLPACDDWKDALRTGQAFLVTDDEVLEWEDP